jgi:hypothetical protein
VPTYLISVTFKWSGSCEFLPHNASVYWATVKVAALVLKINVPAGVRGEGSCPAAMFVVNNQYILQYRRCYGSIFVTDDL